MLHEIKVVTSKKQEIVDITRQVREIVEKSKVSSGLCTVFVPHATAAIIINENYDPNIMLDTIDALNNMVPEGKWRHDKIDGNGAAHIKAAIVGPSESIIINNNELLLGQWQDIALFDFDGPRQRKVLVKITKD